MYLVTYVHTSQVGFEIPCSVATYVRIWLLVTISFVDSTQKPGPGAHYPERVHINKKSPPRFSMGIRHSDYTTPLIVEVTE